MGMMNNLNKNTRKHIRIRHMNINRLKLNEFRLMADVRVNGMTDAKQKRLRKIRANIYGFEF